MLGDHRNVSISPPNYYLQFCARPSGPDEISVITRLRATLFISLEKIRASTKRPRLSSRRKKTKTRARRRNCYNQKSREKKSFLRPRNWSIPLRRASRRNSFGNLIVDVSFSRFGPVKWKIAKWNFVKTSTWLGLTRNYAPKIIHNQIETPRRGSVITKRVAASAWRWRFSRNARPEKWLLTTS